MLYPLFTLCFVLAAKPTTTTATGDKTKAPPTKEGAAKPDVARAPAPVAIPPSPPRIGITALPGAATFTVTFDTRSAKVPSEKLDGVRKALDAAKLDALSSLHGHLKSLFDAAMKSGAEVDSASKEANREKAKLDKLTEAADASKSKSKLVKSAAAVSPSTKANADRAAAVVAKLTDENKVASGAYAVALDTYQKALAEAQPFIDTIRSEAALSAQ